MSAHTLGTRPQAMDVTVDFSEQESALISERAAAHNLTVLEFVRFVVLCCPTPLEEEPRNPGGTGGRSRP